MKQVSHPVLDRDQGIRTYTVRSRRMKPGKLSRMASLYPVHGLCPDLAPPNWLEIMPAATEVFVEIGFGSGEAAVDFAKHHPAALLVGFEVYPAGVACALTNIVAAQLQNFKVVNADALLLLSKWFAPSYLAGLRVFFPDPWPKKRHHKRRLVNRTKLADWAALLRPGGTLHFASDWDDYASAVHAMLATDPNWTILAYGCNDQHARNGRLVTRFERRAQRAGRPVWDLRAAKVLPGTAANSSQL